METGIAACGARRTLARRRNYCDELDADVPDLAADFSVLFGDVDVSDVPPVPEESLPDDMSLLFDAESDDESEDADESEDDLDSESPFFFFAPLLSARESLR